ncbi:MAG TPA: hypothetical protein VNX21_02810 [Candidatus Thermoplasmatota archaeon]|nr:hypothetical protein [Candidatus Thermoplasmatota archaeon]
MRAPLLLLATLLAPVAGACSLAGPVPGPGVFSVEPLAGGEAWRVEVRGRMLGGTCELSNPHALDGDAFAWVEVARLESGAPRDVHVRWRDGTQVVHRGVTRDHVEALALRDGVLLLHARAWASPGAADARTFLRMDARTGEARPLPFPPGDWHPVAAEGSVLVALRRDAEAQRAWLHAYDAAADAWLLRDADLASLGLPWFSGPVEVSERHALFLPPGGPPRVVDLRTGEARDVAGLPEVLLDLDGEWAYGSGLAGLVRVSLEDGRREVLGRAADWNLVSVQQGHVVVGTYADGLAAPERDWRPWAGGALAGVAALALLAWGARRWRRG